MTAEDTTSVLIVILELLFFSMMCAKFLRDKHVKGVEKASKILGMTQEAAVHRPCCRFSTIECKMLKRIQEVEWKQLVGLAVCTQSIKWSAVTPISLYCSPVDTLLIRCIYYIFYRSVPAVVAFACCLPFYLFSIHYKCCTYQANRCLNSPKGR